MPTDNRVLHGQLLPPESRGVRVPGGTPLGLAILGVARFGAIRRVIEQYESALRAKEAAILAEEAVARAMALREVGREQLRQIDRLRDDERERIEHLVTLNRLRRELELIELQNQIAEQRTRQGDRQPVQPAQRREPDAFAAFMDDLRKLPEIVKAVTAAKTQIIEGAGGEGNLSEAHVQACEMLDAMLQSFMSGRTGEAAL